MSRVFVRFIGLIFMIVVTFFSVDVFAKENSIPSLNLENGLVELVYKTDGSNSYTYNGKGNIGCSSSDTNYVTCSVDSKNRRIKLTPIKKTDKDIIITVSASSKNKMIKNNANIKYEDEDEIMLQELLNPVVEVQSSDVKVPDTGSKVTMIGIVMGIVLVAAGGYSIYKRYNFGK